MSVQTLALVWWAVILSDLVLLGAGRLRHLIFLSAAHGVLLGVVVAGMNPAGEGLLVAAAMAALKAGVFPWLLWRTMRRIGSSEIVEPYMGLGTSVVLGLVGLGLLFGLESRVVLPVSAPPLLLPAALLTVLAGIILIVLRHKALTQVIGYLTMENGIFLLGVPLIGHDAMWIEFLILLDLFVAIFVMGIAIHHISRAFDSIDVDRFCTLRD
ncbi:MAG: putative hydrogenase-4 component [Desulfomicrobiaceae bacterium]|jgi:hydrogenase-4 component E|nr:putative hydrogenase-4 component [Desulfomicrobiaceae bacterium]